MVTEEDEGRKSETLSDWEREYGDGRKLRPGAMRWQTHQPQQLSPMNWNHWWGQKLLRLFFDFFWSAFFGEAENLSGNKKLIFYRFAGEGNHESQW